jgi:hypothetical protein
VSPLGAPVSSTRLWSYTMPGYGIAVAARQNFVRPQDVGRRVSFQYELPNGFVSEAVGILEAWDEAANTYLVRTRAGDVARVPALGVRFGKVIPG